MQKVLYLIVLLLVVTNNTTNAQGYSVSGIIKDNTGAVIPTATVSLLKASDSSWVESELTDDKGAYSFKNIVAGEYLVDVHALGYAGMLQPLSVKENMASAGFTMQKGNTILEGVTISSKRPRIETALGKTIVNIDPATVSAASNVLELLRKSPGVVVDGGGNISLKGNSVLVLVDDKQTYLSGDQLADYLRTLTADQVGQLELITQPSSKYDAEGSGGIINIKTRRTNKRGYNGNVAIGGAQGVYPSTHNTGTFNYRNNKLNVYTNVGYLLGNGFLARTDNRKTKDAQTGAYTSKAEQDAYLHEIFEDYSLKLGTDYAINDKVNIGGSAKAIYHPNNEKDITNTLVTDNAGSITNNKTLNYNGFKRDHYICNLYGKYTPAKNQEITADVDYLYRDQRNYQNVTGNNYNEQGQYTGGQVFKNNMTSAIQATVAKADYNITLPRNCKLEAGVKTSMAKADVGTFFEVPDNGVWRNDSTRSNEFIYRENINAAYVSANKDFGKKWKAQAGLRVENTIAGGEQVTQNKNFDRNNTSLFPTGYLSFAPNEKNSFELSCGRRIERPPYTMLNPFTTYSSQFYFNTGNPNLKPSFRNYIECKHSYNNVLFTSVGYRRVKGLITPILQSDSTSKAIYATWGNLANRNIVQGSLAYSETLFKWWMMSASADCYYNEFQDVNGNRQLATSFGYSGGLNNQFILGKGWTIDSNFFYASGDLQNLIDRYGPSFWMDMNIAKKFWKENATIRLGIEDPFYVYRVQSSSNFNGIESKSRSRYATQQVNLGFTYTFSRKNDNVKQQRQNNTEEAGRM